MNIHLQKGEVTRRILPDGKLQEWRHGLCCWLGLQRKGYQFDMTADEIAEEWEGDGWKQISEAEAIAVNHTGGKTWKSKVGTVRKWWE